MGRLIAEAGFVLVTGGRAAGVMDAANEGAKSVDGSLTIGILPNAGAELSEFVDVPVMSAYLLFVAFVFVLTSLMVDLVYVALDPRLRGGGPAMAK